MRSGSRLTTESTSKLPRMEALMPEKPSKQIFDTIVERETTPESDAPHQLPLSIKRNTHLKSFICEQPIRESPEYEEGKENEEMFLVPSRKGSYNMGRRNLQADQTDDSQSDRQSIRGVQFSASQSMIDASASTSLITPKRSFKQPDLPTTPLKTTEITTPKSGLRNSGFSSSTLHRISGLLKRGLSSVGPKTSGQNASPMVKLGRKDSINSAKSTGSRRRRFSDVDCYSHLQQVQFTPTSSFRSIGNPEAVRKLERFKEVVKVSELIAKQELEACFHGGNVPEFDAVVADADMTGKPVSKFSAWLFERFDITHQVSDMMKASCRQIMHNKTIKLCVSQGTSREFLIAIGIVRGGGGDQGAITRNGYDSAIEAALDEGKTKVLIAPAFFPNDTPYTEELASAMIKTVYVIASSKEKLKSITICGGNSAERSLLIRQRDDVIAEKQEAMGPII
ncbi:unnamed protein product, partial [Mesorhabditis belari]|uniref:Uncharacterized protein n=1 Tax=Mesorhabditis belari TaxID=2138241 RepID=A0AAF3ELC4_9BILA